MISYDFATGKIIDTHVDVKIVFLNKFGGIKSNLDINMNLIYVQGCYNRLAGVNTTEAKTCKYDSAYM